ncbi:PstS family phosphate ABC transporter substrate-binding protein [Dokdonella sp. MW10]|uniref:PstS family phosphate ABC transporter substrate-binding protein n=1 Tax=Dokdonella sp. MW10 TaxID=2992926 RepID=UPI003F80949A
MNPSRQHVVSSAKRLVAVGLAMLAFASARAGAAGIDPPDHHAPAGIVRVHGNALYAALVQRWSERFAATAPDVRIEVSLDGSDVGMAKLYTAQADIVLMGREATESEIKAFEWVFRYKPTPVRLGNGSVSQVGKAPALVVFVHRDNPLRTISLPELEAVFGHAPRHASAPIRRWGELGLAGGWADAPIRLYAPHAESGTGRFFRHVVLGDSNKLHWDALVEFDEPVRHDGARDDAGRRILDALARDPRGIALADLGSAGDGVVALEVASMRGRAAYAAATPHLVSRAYPLTRGLHAYVNRKPGVALDPQVEALLRFALGAQGQRILRDDGLVPLSGATRRHQLTVLDRP